MLLPILAYPVPIDAGVTPENPVALRGQGIRRSTRLASNHDLGVRQGTVEHGSVPATQLAVWERVVVCMVERTEQRSRPVLDTGGQYP